MSRTKKPVGTHRVKLTATVAPETLRAIKEMTRPGDGLGQTVDRAIEALRKGEKI